jgi:hypothetical protein
VSSEARHGLPKFLAAAGALFLARIALGTAVIPPGVAPLVDLSSAALFVGLPVAGAFWAATAPWRPASSLGFLLGGAALQAGCVAAVRAIGPGGWAPLLVGSLGQFGLLCWCVGLGALVAGAIKEKNLLLPVAVFLAGLDVFFVFHPAGPVAKALAERPEVFTSVALAVPSAREAAQGGPALVPRVEPFAYVGPADIFFAALFFVCLHRFGMRTAATAKWLVPALCLYLVVTLAPIGLGMLPALVPIGAVVLAVNWREFRLSGQERAMTAFVALVSLAVATYGVWARATKPPAPPPASSLPGGGQAPPEPARSPPPGP